MLRKWEGKGVTEDLQAHGPQSRPSSTSSPKADPQNLFEEGSRELTQLVKALATKPADLCSTPGNHMVGENLINQVVFWQSPKNRVA